MLALISVLILSKIPILIFSFRCKFMLEAQIRFYLVLRYSRQIVAVPVQSGLTVLTWYNELATEEGKYLPGGESPIFLNQAPVI